MCIRDRIRFADGSIGTLHYLANGDKTVDKERLEVFGGGGVVVIEDFRRVKLVKNGKGRRVGHWWSKQDKGHRGEMKAFLQAVRAGGPPPVPLEEAIVSTQVTFEILRSLTTGKPVSLPTFSKGLS